MPYSSQTDIEQRLTAQVVASLTDDSGGSSLDSAKLVDVISDADSLINSYLRSRYSVPFVTDVPKLVVRLSADLAIYFLFQRKYDTDMPETIRFRYTDAVKTLESIQSGRMHLDDVPASESEVPAQVMTNKTAEDRMFTKQLLSRW